MTNRTLCDVLEEMRKAHDTRNYSYLPGLIEEVQSYGNRMEAAIWDKHSISDYIEKLYRLRKKLKAKITELEKKVGEEDD